MSIPVSQLTQATLDGSGVFDVLMRATKAHLEDEFKKNRIKGPEYSTVYLGSLTQVMQTALAFALAQTKTDLENQLLQKQIDLAVQQKLNAEAEHAVLVAQECKLRAEYDLTKQATLKGEVEATLLTQKVATEKAQIQALGVDDNSVLGKQKLLYAAQTDGFKRDAEQKAAKIMIDTWSVQRTTDSGVLPTTANKLTDSYIGSAVGKLLTGVGA